MRSWIAMVISLKEKDRGIEIKCSSEIPSSSSSTVSPSGCLGGNCVFNLSSDEQEIMITKRLIRKVGRKEDKEVKHCT